MLQDVGGETVAVILQRLQLQLSHPDGMLTTIAVQDLPRALIFIRLSLSFPDMRLITEVSDLCVIHENIAKLEYIVTKVA